MFGTLIMTTLVAAAPVKSAHLEVNGVTYSYDVRGSGERSLRADPAAAHREASGDHHRPAAAEQMKSSPMYPEMAKTALAFIESP
jgi:hypothetical protein